MKRYLRQAALGITSLLILASLTACGLGNKEGNLQDIKLDMEQAVYELADAAEFEITYRADISFLKQQYELDESKITNSEALFGTILDANRAVLFEVSDKSSKEEANRVTKAIQEELKENFGEAMPLQKEQAENAKTIEKGNYILFLSGTNVQAGTEAFEKMFSQDE